MEPLYVSKAKQYQKDYYLKHREKKLEYASKYLAENKERINAGRRIAAKDKKLTPRNFEFSSKEEYNKRYHVEVKSEKNLRQKINALQIVSKTAKPICSCCGIEDIRLLCINHINGGGRKEHLDCAPHEFRRKIISKERGADDLNVLCYNCNILYEYNRGRLRLPRDYELVVKEEIDSYGNGLSN
jgi:hypothetical protein